MSDRESKVIAIGSVKHGQGMTSFVYNLSYKLSSLLDKKILILDTNFLFKEIGYMAGHSKKSGIDDLISIVKTQEVTKDIFMLHTEEINDNLYVINSTQIDTMDYIKKNDKHIIKIVEEAKKYFDYVIIDAAAGTKNALTKQIYDISDVFVNMLTQNAYIIDWYMKHDEYKGDKVINVVNLYEDDIYPDLGDMKKEFKFENVVPVRYSKLFKHYYNQKSLDPFYTTGDLFNNDFAQLIEKIAEKLDITELKKLDIVNTNMLIGFKSKKRGLFASIFKKN